MLNIRYRLVQQIVSCDYDNVIIVYKCTCVWMKDKNVAKLYISLHKIAHFVLFFLILLIALKLL